MTTVDAGASVELVLLGDMLGGEARCQVTGCVDCKIVARWASVGCRGHVLWCDSKYEKWQSGLGYRRCTVCLGPTSHWHVYPI